MTPGTATGTADDAHLPQTESQPIDQECAKELPTARYRLPAEHIEEGMSTDDGNDVLSVIVGSDLVLVSVYTPSDDPAVDEENRCGPDTYVYRVGELADMATFPSSPVDGSSHDHAMGPVVAIP
jgi:hypothetical protein